MSNAETLDIPRKNLDPISQIKLNSNQWIETIFIKFLPSKEDIKRYYFYTKLLNKKEALEMAEKCKIKISTDMEDHHFFVYHQNLGIIPFQIWDFIMTDEWYGTTDWKYILCYDNNWNELWFF